MEKWTASRHGMQATFIPKKQTKKDQESQKERKKEFKLITSYVTTVKKHFCFFLLFFVL